MAVVELKKGSFGIAIEICLVDSIDGMPIDLSSETEKHIDFRKPGGDVIQKAAVFSSDGTDGLIMYIVEDGLLDTLGTWSAQARVGSIDNLLPSEIIQFKVTHNLLLTI